MLPFAFVDIETTGSNFERDRITEVAVKTLYANQDIEVWDELINPQTSIPDHIQRLTGISSAMVMDAPSFEDLANKLYRALENKIFVAHNARFDYGFLKAAFKRLDIDFKPKVLCTVKLSRRLFPDQSRHNLDSLIERHGLVVSARHRALGDADLLLQFWRICETKFGLDRLLTEVTDLIGESSVPPHIDKALINEVPDTPGVYILYAEDRVPLYIGKSIHMRTRVMSHFQAALKVRKEMKLALQVRDISWIETSGELGALLLESAMIKQHLPVMNVKLRRSKDLCAWQLIENEKGVCLPKLITHAELQPGVQDNLYGIFHSKREANACLRAIAKESKLCEALLGLEKTSWGKPCFGFQIKQCDGACVGLESVMRHNLKFKMAFEALKIKVWPYAGPIGIREGQQIHVVHNWCYLGVASDEEALFSRIDQAEVEFDLDIYKILKKTLSALPSSNIVVML